MGKRTIRLFGEIDTAASDAFFEEFSKLDAVRTGTLITILLNSPGGDEDEGWAIYDAIRNSRNPVRIIVYGQAFSMAAAIFQAADIGQRLMTRHSSFMMHPGWRDYEEAVHMAKVIAEGKWAEVANAKYLDVIADRTGDKSTFDEVEKAFLKETIFTSDAAVGRGFADAIYEGAIP